jgi:glycosyltransferase involved in cell wall biosynthesis
VELYFKYIPTSAAGYLKQKKMKISIVTISFNQCRYLRACIDSILDQTDCDVEYIVVDPGSTDGSRELIESYGDRLIKVFERDEGPADGLNKGFAKATGEIYGFINSDDYLLPGALKQVSDFFNTCDQNTFVTGHGFTEDESGKRTVVDPTRLTEQSMLHRSAVMFQQTTFFPAALYKTVGCFNNKNRTCWDYELFLNFLQLGAKHYILESDLAVFRLYQDSISGSGRLEEKYFQELDQLFLKYVGRPRRTRDKLLTFCLRVQRVILRRIFNAA